MGYINPLLKLAAGRQLLSLPTLQRLAVAKVCRGPREEANTEAEKAWERRKGPMAAYWRAVSTYARHLAHMLEHGVAEHAAPIDFTESELILIREAVRKLPANTELSEMYGREIASVDRKTTDGLAACFDARMNGSRAV
ncbi:hypothetical protein [Cupriavidus sp. TMH.W2]|uniref:hypothetical protein n=1 Tax=Cupriavidus sp. TMH.W2 TaxID=3434465 RepID=UPI003D780D0F